MSILTLLVANVSAQGLTPALVISSVIGFIILVLLIGYSLRGREASAGPSSSEGSKKLEGEARAQERERVIDLAEKVQEAKAAPGLDEASDLLSAGLDKARRRE